MITAHLVQEHPIILLNGAAAKQPWSRVFNE